MQANLAAVVADEEKIIVRVALQGAAKTGSGGRRNDSLRVKTCPVRARNGSLSVCNEFVRGRNDPLCVRNDPLRARNDPLSGRNGPVRLRNESSHVGDKTAVSDVSFQLLSFSEFQLLNLCFSFSGCQRFSICFMSSDLRRPQSVVSSLAAPTSVL